MTATPVRLQLSRRKGIDLHALSIATNGLPAKHVARPGRHGNPYYPGSGHGRGGFDAEMRLVVDNNPAPATCVKWFAELLAEMRAHEPENYAFFITPLRDTNLACWCGLCAQHAIKGKPLGVVCEACDPCHADVLLELANGGDA
jgi:hypothetical protein